MRLNLKAMQLAILGQSMQEYRQERLHEAFEAEAERLGFFAWELTLQLTSETPEDFQAQRLEVHREVAQMAGMEWPTARASSGFSFSSSAASSGRSPRNRSRAF